MLRAWIVAATSVLALATSSVALAKGYELGGRVNLEAKNRSKFAEGDLDKEGVFELQTPRYEGVRAVTDVRISSENGGLQLRDLYIDVKEEDETRWSVGQSKKRMGLEWDWGLENRLALTRGPIYRKLGALNFVGRDTFAEYRPVGGDTFAHRVSLHTSEGVNASLLYLLEGRISESAFWKSSTQIMGAETEHTWRPTGLQVLSVSNDLGFFRTQAEAFFGEDYLETTFNEERGQKRHVYFAAATAAARRRWGKLEPYARTSLIYHDLQNLGRNSVEGSLGSRLYFRDRLYLGGEVQAVRSSFEGFTSFDSGTEALLTLRYFFDGQVD